MLDSRLDLKRARNLVGQLQHRTRLIGSDVEHLAVGSFNQRRAGYDRSDVTYVREGARLQAIAKDRHRLARQDLIHEDAYHVAVLIGNILEFPIDVVRPEDYVR